MTEPERGAALLAAVVCLLVFGGFGTAYWSQLHVTLAHARGFAKEQRAHALAEAGIARALAELRAGNTGFAGTEPCALGEGFYTVRVAPAPGGALLLEATGALGSAAEPLHAQRIQARVQGAAGAALQIQYLPEAR